MQLRHLRLGNLKWLFVVGYLFLSFLLYFASYLNYYDFATNKDRFVGQITSLEQSQLGQRLFNESLAASELTRIITFEIALVLFLVVAIELLALRLWYQNFGLKLRKILKSTGVFLIVHLLYLLPLYLIGDVSNHVAAHLSLQAGVEIAQAKQSLSQQTDLEQTIVDEEAIHKQLSENDNPPSLLSGRFGDAAILGYLRIAPGDSFYRTFVIPSITASQEEFETSSEMILFVADNKIAIGPNLSIADLSRIMTIITHKSIKNSIAGTYTDQKKTPTITILPEQEYLKLIQAKKQERQNLIEAYIDSIETSITETKDYIQRTEALLASHLEEQTAAKDLANKIYAECQDSHGVAECQEVRESNQAILDIYAQNVELGEAYLAEAREYIPQLNSQYQEAQKSLSDFLAYPVVPELQAAIFEPPSSIFVKHQNQSTRPTEYYYTLLHELFHYYSDSSNASLPIYLEEGITDLLATRVGSKFGSIQEKATGYPEEVEIATKLFDLLGEDRVIKFYFQKSARGLETELDQKCGEGCYRKLTLIGNELSFTKPDDRDKKSELLNQALALLEHTNP